MKKIKKNIKVLFFFFLAAAIICFSFLVLKKPFKTNSETNPTFFRTEYIPSNAQIVRLEINIYDDITKDFFDIINAEFNGKKINLLKPDASGRRARTYFQMKPGKYMLKWTVSKSYFWPRYKTYKKMIKIDENDNFIHILIEGDKIIIS